VIVAVSVGAACALALLSLRSLAFAVSHSVGSRPAGSATSSRDYATLTSQALTRRQIATMLVEIAMSLSIALLSIGLAAAAALPASLLIGALLAQFAVLGALFAPPVQVTLGSITVRPAALALGIAQLAHVAFFLRAIEALI
jgi:hypothetical protein